MQKLKELFRLAFEMLLYIVLVVVVLGIGLCLSGFVFGIVARVFMYGYNLLPI